ncbi:MAG: lipase family protein [bacterium]|nr:lipase family protein [bacterium]
MPEDTEEQYIEANYKFLGNPPSFTLFVKESKSGVVICQVKLTLKDGNIFLFCTWTCSDYQINKPSEHIFIESPIVLSNEEPGEAQFPIKVRLCEIIGIDNNLSLVNAYTFAYFSEVIYNEKTVVEKQVKDSGFSTIKFFEYAHPKETGEFYKKGFSFIASNDFNILICFRGSHDYADYVADFLSAVTEPFEPGKVGVGFYKCLKSVWKELYEELLNLRNKNQNIWITGHSLGGAVAVLCVANLLKQDRISCDDVGLYTYGQPLVGDKKFSDYLKDSFPTKYFRFINAGDVVPTIPFRDFTKNEWFNYATETILYFEHEVKKHRLRSKKAEQAFLCFLQALVIVFGEDILKKLDKIGITSSISDKRLKSIALNPNVEYPTEISAAIKVKDTNSLWEFVQEVGEMLKERALDFHDINNYKQYIEQNMGLSSTKTIGFENVSEKYDPVRLEN